jgi:hypothetical protein
VEPLREVLKTRPLGWPAEAPIVHAAGIVGMLRPLSRDVMFYPRNRDVMFYPRMRREDVPNGVLVL